MKGYVHIYEYPTPFGIYAIGDLGEAYQHARPIDTTPVSPTSPVNIGGFDILHDDDFIVKCETLNEAKDTLKIIVNRVHRYKVEGL